MFSLAYNLQLIRIAANPTSGPPCLLRDREVLQHMEPFGLDEEHSECDSNGLFQGFLIMSVIWFVNDLASWNWSMACCGYCGYWPKKRCQDVLCHRRISVLSSGQKCKLALGAAFWTRPCCQSPDCCQCISCWQHKWTWHSASVFWFFFKPRLNTHFFEMLRWDARHLE